MFDLWSTEGMRAQIFTANYSKGQVTADGLFEVPDGYDLSQTTLCSSSVVAQRVSGETSLMKTQTNEIKFNAEAGYLGMSGSLENNNLFKEVSSLTCKLYQVGYQSYAPPGMTANFAGGLNTLRVAMGLQGNWPAQGLLAQGRSPTAVICRSEAPLWCKSEACRSVFLTACSGAPGALLETGNKQLAPAQAAQAFLSEFGTHYMSRGSLGSALMSTTSTTKEQLSKLQSSRTSVEVGASASFWGQSVGTSVLNQVEQERASSSSWSVC
jgi:hypothetical protein